MNKNRKKRGFTLLETLLAVAIITILSGVGAVNIMQYLRGLAQLELDGIAREIYVAAQNHLTMAESQGFVEVAQGTEYIDSDGKKWQNVYYYVISNQDGNSIDNSSPNALNALKIMLPYGSVDETVRKGGSFIIRYLSDPAIVVDVFYAENSGRYKHTFGEEEIKIDPTGGNDFFANLRGEDKKNERRQLSDDSVIGWYGAAGNSLEDWVRLTQDGSILPPGDRLQKPVIRVVNAERLYVDVTNPNAYVDKAGLRLIVEGVQSGNKWTFDLVDKNGIAKFAYEVPLSNKKQFHIVLDDVTSDSNRFTQIFNPSPIDAKKNLLPGEDITVYVLAYNVHYHTNYESSDSFTTNSLFAKVEQENGTATAKISNFRHLENLCPDVSYITVHSNVYTIPSSDVKPAIKITQAEQTANMDWGKFQDAVKKGEEVHVYANNSVLSDNGCYLPITNNAQIAYNGNGKTIQNVKINTSNDAGLFAALSSGSSVSNLQLVDFQVTSSNQSAGTLAGTAYKANITNVLAYNSLSSDSSDVVTVTGKGTTGGLVGRAVNSTIEKSAAALVVSSTDNSGGLIGTAENSTIAACYSGGHTQDAKYSSSDMNVRGTGSVGGLVGSISGGKIENSYSTCSAQGTVASAKVGGLMGSATGGTEIKNCYSTGLVQGTAGTKTGVFAGSIGSSTFTGNNLYYGLVNEVPVDNDPKKGYESLSAVGESSNDYASVIVPFDSSLSLYRDFVGTDRKDAVPYDNKLIRYYRAKYPFPTAAQLSADGVASGDFVTIHYGDWPVMETFVLNDSN